MKEIKEWVDQPSDCENNYRPVHWASNSNDPNIFRILERYGAEFDVANNKGVTPMHIAAEYDHAFSISFLKARGISVDCQDY
jgi:ankyrin repeat protein